MEMERETRRKDVKIIIPPGEGVTFRRPLKSLFKRGEEEETFRLKASREELFKYTLYTISALLFILFFYLALSGFHVTYQLHPKIHVRIDKWNLIMIAYILGFGPPTIYLGKKFKRIEEAEEGLTDFLRDLAESMRAGQTLHEAIITASRGDYGTLTPEIKKMARQITWGVPATKALEMFARRLPTPLIKRSVSLINRANEAGGNISSVLEAAANDARELQLMKKNRKMAMGEYTLVIVVAFLVFLAVIAIIFRQFVPPMQELSESYSKEGGLGAGMTTTFNPQNVDFAKIRLLFLLAGFIQAIGDGIVAGIMSRGSLTHGLRLSVFMVLAVLIVFMTIL